MSIENRLTRELQNAHDAVRDYPFAEHGRTDYRRMVEFLRLVAAKRSAQARVNAYIASLFRA